MKLIHLLPLSCNKITDKTLLRDLFKLSTLPLTVWPYYMQ